MNKEQEKRFWDKVDKSSDSGCWSWVAGKNWDGYGKFRINGKAKLAHRLSYVIHTSEEVPDGMCVLHRCDNPSCVNPAHLFLGTHQDNMIDKVNKGRGVKGDRNGRAKLNAKKVLAIRALYKTRMTYAMLANKYNVSERTIRYIVRRETWTHI